MEILWFLSTEIANLTNDATSSRTSEALHQRRRSTHFKDKVDSNAICESEHLLVPFGSFGIVDGQDFWSSKMLLQLAQFVVVG